MRKSEKERRKVEDRGKVESDGSMGEIRRIPADLADLADLREGNIAMGLST
jgi:hypothetical protein